MLSSAVTGAISSAKNDIEGASVAMIFDSSTGLGVADAVESRSKA
jgi:hypothetical protein